MKRKQLYFKNPSNLSDQSPKKVKTEQNETQMNVNTEKIEVNIKVEEERKIKASQPSIDIETQQALTNLHQESMCYNIKIPQLLDLIKRGMSYGYSQGLKSGYMHVQHQSEKAYQEGVKDSSKINRELIQKLLYEAFNKGVEFGYTNIQNEKYNSYIEGMKSGYVCVQHQLEKAYKQGRTDCLKKNQEVITKLLYETYDQDLESCVVNIQKEKSNSLQNSYKKTYDRSLEFSFINTQNEQDKSVEEQYQELVGSLTQNCNPSWETH